MTVTSGHSRPPVLLLGGDYNAVSVARSLHRQGIRVYAVNRPNRPIRYTRTAKWVQPTEQPWGPDAWTRFLLGHEAEWLHGAVLFPCGDDAIAVVIENREALSQHFILEETTSEARAIVLDKLATYDSARAAGIPHPNFCTLNSINELDIIEKSLRFPIIVKPRQSGTVGEYFGKRKLVRFEAYEDLLEDIIPFQNHIESLVFVEFITGLDRNLYNYCAYMDANGVPLLEFTKDIIRRNPPNMGAECAGVTNWDPTAAELGLKFFRHIGYKGLATLEFKVDPNDGSYKIIECNGRFTGSTVLMRASGLDVAVFVYNHLAGIDEPVSTSYRKGVHWWHPGRDVVCFLRLWREGKVSFWGWLKTLGVPYALPLFAVTDPVPTLVTQPPRIYRLLVRSLRNVFRSLLGSAGNLGGHRSRYKLRQP